MSLASCHFSGFYNFEFEVIARILENLCIPGIRYKYFVCYIGMHAFMHIFFCIFFLPVTSHEDSEGSWNVGLLSLLCHSAELSFLWDAEWTPGLLNANIKNRSLEDFQSATSRLVAQCLNQLCHRWPPSLYFFALIFSFVSLKGNLDHAVMLLIYIRKLLG